MYDPPSDSPQDRLLSAYKKERLALRLSHRSTASTKKQDSESWIAYGSRKQDAAPLIQDIHSTEPGSQTR